MLTAEWAGIDDVDAAIARRTGQVLVAPAPAPGVGWP
jgi:predicted enzyme related to lactoylglutathione lyase